MTKAYAFGARTLWIANVGDIKPAEIGVEWFLQLAWEIDRWPLARLPESLDVLPGGDTMTMRMVVYGTHRGTFDGIPATGRSVAVNALQVLRVANGRIAEWWAAEDDLALLRQLGAVVAVPERCRPSPAGTSTNSSMAARLRSWTRSSRRIAPSSCRACPRKSAASRRSGPS